MHQVQVACSRFTSSCVAACVACLVTLLLVTTNTTAALMECNFDRYATGCYSQANFVCDRDSNRCVCQPASPILIENRICVARVPGNGRCIYNEQCDNSRGYHCLCATTTHNNDNRPVGNRQPLSSGFSRRDFYSRCRCLLITRVSKLKQQHKQHQHQQSSTTTMNQLDSYQQHLIRSKPLRDPHLNQSVSSTRLSPFLWLSLFALLVLMLILPLTRMQISRVNKSLQVDRDFLSLGQAHDDPPPYEVAISSRYI